VHVGPPIDGPVTFDVAPYGLVAKASAWYLVGAREGRVRAYAAVDVLAAEPIETTFERPADFDLAKFWNAWCTEIENERPTLTVIARVAPDLWPTLGWYLGREPVVPMAPLGEPEPGSWVTVALTFSYFEEARARLLGLGGAVEVLQPLALRFSLRDFAEQAAAVYASCDTASLTDRLSAAPDPG
jgi:predicted DNA-binding transcriptional regulator YafY